MSFTLEAFLFLFLPLTLIIYRFIKDKYKNAFLLLASVIFYMWGSFKTVFVLIAYIAVNYLLARLVDKNKKKIFVVLAVIFNVGLLFVFKYLNVPMMPLGISFISFTAISYVVDIYTEKSHFSRNPLNTALYISFFPKVSMGPIARYSEMEDALEARECKEDSDGRNEDFAEGIIKFIFGLAKKVIIAGAMAQLADKLYALAPKNCAVSISWIASIAYTLQIYFDFSGYSDMAIGLSGMFGFRLKENFNYPYAASSITDFWRRWHISLSSWFKDYVYIPLGGSRRSKWRTYFNLAVVWILTGLWHGTTLNFVLWGIWYLILLYIEKPFVKKLSSDAPKTVRALYRVFVLLCVNIGWILFRLPDLDLAMFHIKNLFGLNGQPVITEFTGTLIKDIWGIGLIAIIACMPISEWIRKYDKTKWYRIGRIALAAVLFILSLSYVSHSSYNPFIYSNF